MRSLIRNWLGFCEQKPVVFDRAELKKIIEEIMIEHIDKDKDDHSFFGVHYSVTTAITDKAKRLLKQEVESQLDKEIESYKFVEKLTERIKKLQIN